MELLWDLIVLAFGNGRRPDFSAVHWQSNPSSGLNKLSYADPEAVWLDKRTSEPCVLQAKLSDGVEVSLSIGGRSRYDLDILVQGKSLKGQAMADTASREVIDRIFAMRPQYIPPPGVVSPAEEVKWRDQMRQFVDSGRRSECWRGQLFWLWNDGDKNAYSQVVDMVRKYLPVVVVLPPRLSEHSPARVLIEFEEHGTQFDIGTSGGGLRTVLNLATVLHFSESHCLLCDEPDSHLHPSLQRTISRMLLDFCLEEGRQVLLATHAPDFIAEVPVESLVWVDRAEKAGRTCSQIGQVLVDLGAMSKADALRVHGADKILFVEGDLDKAVLRHLFDLAGVWNPFTDNDVIVAALPSGKGDAAHLRAFGELLRATLSLDVVTACLTDNDYDFPLMQDADKAGTSPLLLRLPCKEVENCLLDADAVTGALQAAAARKELQTGKPTPLPDVGTIHAKTASLVGADGIRDLIRCQVIPRYRDDLDRELDASTRERQADEWFQRKWVDET